MSLLFVTKIAQNHSAFLVINSFILTLGFFAGSEVTCQSFTLGGRAKVGDEEFNVVMGFNSKSDTTEVYVACSSDFGFSDSIRIVGLQSGTIVFRDTQKFEIPFSVGMQWAKDVETQFLSIIDTSLYDLEVGPDGRQLIFTSLEPVDIADFLSAKVRLTYDLIQDKLTDDSLNTVPFMGYNCMLHEIQLYASTDWLNGFEQLVFMTLKRVNRQ